MSNQKIFSNIHFKNIKIQAQRQAIKMFRLSFRMCFSKHIKTSKSDSHSSCRLGW